ncbi:hypothetical protein B1H10_02000, partial [candidate division KSB1 bacterium 4484_188]
NNFYNLFRKSAQLQAKAVVVVDADLRSITPEWIRDLGSPILKEGFDFITPLYSRNEYDGTITNNICYPLIYGLLGKDIRQPIGGDFALSGKLGNHYLSQNWQETTRQYGVDIFMTLHAITGGFQIGQVGLGAKIHKPSAPKLGPMFTQVIGTLFNTLLDNKWQWNSRLSIRKLPLFGRNILDDPQNMSVVGTLFNTLLDNKWQWNSRLSIRKLPLFGRNILDDPQNLSVDYKSTKSTAIKEFTLHRKTLQSSLTPEIFSKVSVMFDSGKINIGTNLWAKIVYDLLYSYEQSSRNPELIEAMKALYFGRVVSFIKRTLELNHVQSEEMIRDISSGCAAICCRNMLQQFRQACSSNI